jgi:ligand-binding sensor domain-containing protein
MLVVYGSEQGIPDGCAWSAAFKPDGTPLVGGYCGILEPTDGRWDLIADEEAVGQSLMDLAVDHEGGIWVGSPDQRLRRLVGDSVAEMEIGSPYVTVGLDGTIWAIDFPPYTGPPAPATLVSYSAGSWKPIGGASVDNGASEGVRRIAVGSDGTVWVLIGDELARVADDALEAVDFGRPDHGSPMFVATSPDGAVWVVVESNEVVDRLGVSDKLAYIVRYDGSSSTSLEVPFAEISDLAVHPDGTVWASSFHGVFSYDGEEWTRYGMAEGMPVNQVDFVEIGPDGWVYAGTPLGLVQIRTDR